MLRLYQNLEKIPGGYIERHGISMGNTRGVEVRVAAGEVGVVGAGGGVEGLRGRWLVGGFAGCVGLD